MTSQFDVSAYAKGITRIPDPNAAAIKALIYGPSGVGKTRLARTFSGGPVLFANVEDGYLTLAGSDIEKVDLRNESDFTRLFLYLKAGQHPFKMVFVDSFSEAKRFESAAVAHEKVANRQAKNPYQLSQDDYRQANEFLKQWMWDMRSLPMHVIYICLDATQRRKGDLHTKQIPDLGESLAAVAMAYVDLVGYMEIVDAVKREADGTEIAVKARKLWLQPTADYDAKIRLPWRAPEAILSPTLDKIIGLYTRPEEKKA